MTINVNPERSTLTLPGARLRPDQPTLRAGPNGVTSGPASRELPAVAVARGLAGDAAALRAASAGLDRASSILDAGLAAANGVASLLAELRDGGGVGKGGVPAMLAEIRRTVDAGGFEGANLIGGDLPGGALKLPAGLDGGEDMVVRGYDFRPGGPIIAVDAEADGPTVAAQAEAALAKVDFARNALDEDGKRVGAHRAFLALLADAGAVAGQSLDVDGARLAALSIKQTIGGTTLTLSNGGPQSVLSLFR